MLVLNLKPNQIVSVTSASGEVLGRIRVVSRNNGQLTLGFDFPKQYKFVVDKPEPSSRSTFVIPQEANNG